MYYYFNNLFGSQPPNDEPGQQYINIDVQDIYLEGRLQDLI